MGKVQEKKAKAQALAKATAAKKKNVHPKSREARRMNRSFARGAKLTRQKNERSAAVVAFGRRAMWFKDNLLEDAAVLTLADVHSLIRAFLSRHDAELEEIRQVHAAARSRPKASREDTLVLLKEQEAAEYRSGFRIPDLLRPNGVRALRAWTGELKFLQSLPCTRLAESGESSAAAALEDAEMEGDGEELGDDEMGDDGA